MAPNKARIGIDQRRKVEEDLEDYDANDYENEDNMRVGENVRIFGEDREDRNREDRNRED